MTPKFSKEIFLADFHQCYSELKTLLSKIDPNDMNTPMQPESWSVKDVIAHIAWHEREMIGVIKGKALIGSELWEQPTDLRNAIIYKTYKNHSLDQILIEAEQTHAELISVLETITTEDLNNASHFAEMPPEWTPGDLIAENTYKHYQDHIPEIQAWIID